VTSPKSTKSTPAVLYLRMSSAKQDQSIPAQRTELQRYARKHGFHIVGEYIDEAISGDDTAKRAGFLKMREDCKSGRFKVVLCWDQDRFGRFDPIEGGHWILPFRDAGVRLETIAQGPIDWTDFAGRLIYMVQQEGKHAYLRDLSRNALRGSIAAARNGGLGTGGAAPQGLKGDDTDAERAKIVRRIFREYLKPGSSLRSITAKLNSDGIPSSRGGKWTLTAVRAVLTNQKYVGDFVWGATAQGRYHAARDGEIIPRAKTDKPTAGTPIIRKGNHKGLVSRKVFKQVQNKLAGNKKATARKSGRQYPLSGLLRCSDCGAVLCGFKAPRGDSYAYRCSTSRNNGGCHCNTIQERPLLDCLAAMIEEKYLSPEGIERVRAAIEKKLSERRKATPADPNKLQKQIDAITAKIDQGAERVFSAPAEIVPTLYSSLAKLKQQREALEGQLEATTRPQTGPDGKDALNADRAVKALRDLRSAFSQAGPAETQKLLRAIVSKVELSFTHTPGKVRTRHEFKSGTIYLRPDPSAVMYNSAGTISSVFLRATALSPNRHPAHKWGHLMAGWFRASIHPCKGFNLL